MSASVVSIPNNDYIVKVTPGGTITFDTGPTQGTVVFTGDFTVGGSQTIVNSTNLDVQDNIITVNSGETDICRAPAEDVINPGYLKTFLTWI